jgi:hypothetical protein
MGMEVTYKPSTNLEIKFQAAGQKELVDMMAGLQEVLQQSCQKCKMNAGNTFVVRTVGKHTFRELKCRNPQCGAVLGFGSHDGGKETIFPQRRYTTGPKKGELLPDMGWGKWNPETEERE